MPGHRFLALVALLGCVAVGCSEAESDPPDDEPSRSVGDAPTAKQSEATEETEETERDVDVPTMPRRARKNTLKGAEAFVRHYIDLLNYSANTGKVGGLRKAAESCDGCKVYEDLYRKTYVRGGYIQTPGWRPVDVQAFRQRNGAVVLVTVDAPQTRFKRTASDELFIGRRGTHKLRFDVGRLHRSRWVVTYFGVQADLPSYR